MGVQPILTFQKYRIEKYHYDVKNDSIEIEKPDFDLEIGGGISEDLKVGKVIIELKIDAEKFDLELKVVGYFDIHNSLKEESDIEKALIVNGTAIVFPYVRSMVSMLTSLDSENAFLLPTINTTNLIDDL